MSKKNDSHAKLIAKLAHKDYKQQARALKAQRKYKKYMANREIKKLRLQRRSWSRIFLALKFIIPVISPLIYRAITALRDTQITKKQ